MVLFDHNSTSPVWSGYVLVSLSGSVSVLRSLGPGEVVLVAVILSTWHSPPLPAPAICIEGVNKVTFLWKSEKKLKHIKSLIEIQN